MIEHVYRRASASPVVSRVIVATDDLRIATRVAAFGGNVRLTRADHPTGTDRLAEVATSLDCDVIVNVQGDEPLLDPRAITELVAPFADKSVSMSTLYRRITDQSELLNPNIVKLVTDPFTDITAYLPRSANAWRALLPPYAAGEMSHKH
mgnify:CR=1 FL=1